jgi:prepilin-type N-terminal cleavage/methylation domain-containing protein
MTARLAAEDGFTLVELLVSMIVGTVVIFAALSVMDGSWRLSAKTTDHIDATNRGRLAMDKITQQLGSRICLNSQIPAQGTSPAVPAQGSLVTATDSEIEFYASVTNETAGAPRLVVERRRMTYRSSTNDIQLKAWTGSAPPPTAPPAYPTEPTFTRIVAEGVEPAVGTPIFRYYVQADAAPLVPPISLTNANTVLLVRVNFNARGNRPDILTELQNDSLTRSPTCPF